MKTINQSRYFLFASFALLISTSLSCNLFEFMDKPSGDRQILSKARACLDRLDLTCAFENYALLSDDYSEIRASEEAFAILEESGAGMAAVMEAIGDGGSANGLVILANKMLPGSETKRNRVFEAYKKIDSITSNTELRGLVRFLTGFALASELLAESELDDGSSGFASTDLSSDRTSCIAAACAGSPASCIPSGGPSLAQDGTDEDLDNLTTLTSKRTLNIFHSALVEVDFGLTSELQATGSFSTGTASFSSALLNSGKPNALGTHCYRQALLNQGLGS